MKIISDESLEYIKQKTGRENVFENEPMSLHSNMQVGGPAAYYFLPGSIEDIRLITGILYAEDIPFYVVGKCSNIIFRDEGFDGAIIRIGSRMSSVEIHGERVRALAGIENKVLSDILISAGLSGFEFASGIPGSLGGSIAMNAGAYDGEMSDVIETVTVLEKDGSIKVLASEDMDFGYRKSCIAGNGYVVVEATLKLKKAEPQDIQERVDDLTAQRKSRQPLEYPSCGSVFKRPEGYFAGALITKAGLKGYTIGGAQVSQKHAGFIINRDHATADDILKLISHIQNTVAQDSGVELKCEVKII